MKLHTFHILTILFVAVFVLTKGEESGEESRTHARRLAQIAASSVSMTPNNLRLGETPTLMTVKFTHQAALAENNTIIITTNLAVFKASATGIPITLIKGFTECSATGAESSSGKIFTITLADDGTCAVGANAVTEFSIPTEGLAANPSTVNNIATKGVVTVIVNTDGTSVTASTEKNAYTIGLIAPYFVKSECRSGGLLNGALKNCVGNPSHCKTCSDGFVITHGPQNTATDCVSGSQVRCDALQHYDDSVDLYFTTNGNYGTAVCGAFGISASALAYNILAEPLGTGTSDLISKNSVTVKESGKYLDHVINLGGLTPDTQYAIFCHMDELVTSPLLKVWTHANKMLWDVSYTATPTTVGAAPSTTLTFTHGTALADADTIKLSAGSGSAGGTVSIYTSDTAPLSCTATTTTPKGVTTNLLLTDAVVSDATPDLLTITLNGASTAGNTIVVSCDTTNMANNPSAAHFIIFDLDVTDHNKVYKQKGWTSTAA